MSLILQQEISLKQKECLLTASDFKISFLVKKTKVATNKIETHTKKIKKTNVAAELSKGLSS